MSGPFKYEPRTLFTMAFHRDVLEYASDAERLRSMPGAGVWERLTEDEKDWFGALAEEFLMVVIASAEAHKGDFDE